MTTHLHAKPAGTPTWIDLTAPDAEAAQMAIQQFFDDGAGDALVLNKWFSMQAGADV